MPSVENTASGPGIADVRSAMLRGTFATFPDERSRNSATGNKNSKFSPLELSTDVQMLGDEAVRSHAQTPKDPAGPSKRRKAWRVALFIGSMLSTETMTRKLRADADDWYGLTAVAMIKLAAGCDARAFLSIEKNKCGDDGCKQCVRRAFASKLLRFSYAYTLHY